MRTSKRIAPSPHRSTSNVPVGVAVLALVGLGGVALRINAEDVQPAPAQAPKRAADPEGRVLVNPYADDDAAITKEAKAHVSEYVQDVARAGGKVTDRQLDDLLRAMFTRVRAERHVLSRIVERGRARGDSKVAVATVLCWAEDHKPVELADGAIDSLLEREKAAQAADLRIQRR